VRLTTERVGASSSSGPLSSPPAVLYDRLRASEPVERGMQSRLYLACGWSGTVGILGEQERLGSIMEKLERV